MAEDDKEKSSLEMIEEGGIKAMVGILSIDKIREFLTKPLFKVFTAEDVMRSEVRLIAAEVLVDIQHLGVWGRHVTAIPVVVMPRSVSDDLLKKVFTKAVQAWKDKQAELERSSNEKAEELARRAVAL